MNQVSYESKYKEEKQLLNVSKHVSWFWQI